MKPISQFTIYEELVKREGLYGQAFFGHKATKEQQKTLRKLHNRSIYLWKQRDDKLKELLRSE